MEEESNQAKWHRGTGSDFNSNQFFREKVRRLTPRKPIRRGDIVALDTEWCAGGILRFASVRNARPVLQLRGNDCFIFLCTVSCATQVRRNEYIARGPRERYARTLTAVQEHGWQDQLEINKQVTVREDPLYAVVFACDFVHRFHTPTKAMILAPNSHSRGSATSKPAQTFETDLDATPFTNEPCSLSDLLH